MTSDELSSIGANLRARESQSWCVTFNAHADGECQDSADGNAVARSVRAGDSEPHGDG